MAGTNGRRRTRRAQARRIYCIRRAVVACCAVLLVAAVTLSVRATLGGLGERHVPGATAVTLAAPPSATAEPSATPSSGDSATPEPSATPSETASPEEQALDAQSASISDKERQEIMAKAQETAKASGAAQVTMTYCVSSKGKVGSTDGFANAIYRSLNDTKGWPRAGVTFEPVSEGCDVTLTLSEPSQVPSFSPMCSAEYSCRVGSDVIINKKRWDNGVEAWLKAGGTLADYRTMVINHEVGHALGHIDNEQTCAGEGQPAPLMQEQSMHLDGCKPNIHPLDSELWTAF
ncbi:DUF3152 domain-containing protein [Bifidobacterium cuniculi]|uniref:Membrane protein n=1 Tax=Bifidobacterium cuniculi TaxID=1688 RepID=A0A087AIH8_9BIFI|nr:DUF3152 domain-containing protein [Bifidobacterium cuniculi]KFI58578.1 membrane protein [Bifidobacterium cuniculi]